MGKTLSNAQLVRRTGRLAFYLVPGHTTYTRMEGFTSLSKSHNPTEYERQYVDEDTKRTDITGYSEAVAYEMDRYKSNDISDDIAKIHDHELLCDDALRWIIDVDMTTATNTNGRNWTASARRRQYAVIPDADGDGTDALIYSGNFKAHGEAEDITVTTTDDFQTLTVSGEETPPVLKSLAVMFGGSASKMTPAFSGTTETYTVACGAGTVVVTAQAESDSYTVMGTCNGAAANLNHASATFTVAVNDYIYVTVNKASSGTASTSMRTYKIKIAAKG